MQIKVWETYLLDTDWELYTLRELADFGFRCRDFAPDLIVLGRGFTSEESISTASQEVSQIPVIPFQNEEAAKEELSFPVPFKPEDIGAILDELLAKSKSL